MKLFKVVTLLVVSLALANCSSSSNVSEESEVGAAHEPVSLSSYDKAIFEMDADDNASEDIAANEESEEESEPNNDEVAADNFAVDVDATTAETDSEESAVAPQRETASYNSDFKAGMHKFTQKCNMKSEPSESGKNAGSVSAGKKLWLDNHDGQWVKAYKKSGTVYINKNCL